MDEREKHRRHAKRGGGPHRPQENPHRDPAEDDFLKHRQRDGDNSAAQQDFDQRRARIFPIQHPGKNQTPAISRNSKVTSRNPVAACRRPCGFRWQPLARRRGHSGRRSFPGASFSRRTPAAQPADDRQEQERGGENRLVSKKSRNPRPGRFRPAIRAGRWFVWPRKLRRAPCPRCRSAARPTRRAAPKRRRRATLSGRRWRPRCACRTS